jgi:hypothetical protein
MITVLVIVALLIVGSAIRVGQAAVSKLRLLAALLPPLLTARRAELSPKKMA